MKKHPFWKGILFVVFSAVIFGLMPLMSKLIYAQGVNPVTLVLLRNLISVPILALLALFTNQTLKVPAKGIPFIGLLALMGCCFTPLLLFSSYQFIPSGTATVFHFIYPAVVFIGEWLIFRQKTKTLSWVSLVLCIGGICLFYTPGESINLFGSGLALVSGITYATYILMLSKFRYKEISGFVFAFYVALICSVFMFIVCFATHQLMLPKTGLGWGLSVLFALSLNVGAVVLFQKGTFLIGGKKASVLSTMEPITSILAGAIIFFEPVSFATLIGAGLVILASILIALSN